MDRRTFLGNTAGLALGTGLMAALGCRGRQKGEIMDSADEDLIGSHQAGSAVYKPLVDESVGRLLAKETGQLHVGQQSHLGGPYKRICFIGVVNESSEELGDFKEHLYESIDARIAASDVFQPVAREYVEAGFRRGGFRPSDLFVPSNQQAFMATMEQMQMPFEYLLWAKLTSGSTVDNVDSQRDYTLTLKLINVSTGTYHTEFADISKRYNRSAKAKVSSKVKDWFHF